MAIFVQAKDLQTSRTDMKVDSFTSKMVYGKHVSIMESVREPGYHSRPHYHTNEQYNICLEGELYFYTDKQAYKMKPGDIIRLPPNTVHWAQNRGEVPCRQLAIHSPTFENCCQTAVGLFDENEPVPAPNGIENLYGDFDPEMIRRMESMPAIGED